MHTPSRRGRFLPVWIGPSMAVSSASLLIAALVHLDVRIPLGFGEISGEWFPRAAIPEGLTALVLAAGAAIVFVAPKRAWGAAVAVHTFASLAVIVGLFMIAIGVGPQTLPDVVYHIALLAALTAGLFALSRSAAKSNLGPP